MSTNEHALDELCVNSLRMLAVDAVESAKSGHPGMPLGAAPMAYVIWTRFMRHNPASPDWPDRDRFILSAGHASALLYALLYMAGYDMPLDELKRFRQYGSATPGHPEYAPSRGIEVTTGPLGQGFANGVGMALAERLLADDFNRDDLRIVDHYTYAIVSDGDIMEGIAAEAASLAGHLGLGKIIYLYDDNGITIEGKTDLTFSEDVGARFEAYNWHVQHVADGNDIDALCAAITQARAETARPSLICVRTHIGYGSPKQDTASAHGEPLGLDAAKAAKEFFGWPTESAFHVPEEALSHFRKCLERGSRWQSEWETLFSRYRKEFPDEADRFERQFRGQPPDGWAEAIPVFTPDNGPIATRAASGKVMNAIAPVLPDLVGGSADLAPSTKTLLDGFDKRNLHYGIREHAMGGIVNGMAHHGGVIPFGATFLVFADYMRGSVRLAALSDIHSIFIFTHDSIGVGEDGPTHQPIEQIASLRAIPGLAVIRPADANETAVAWRIAVESRGPVALALTRQKLPILDAGRFGVVEGAAKGAYVLSDSDGKPDVILIATGSEVHLALSAQKELAEQGVAARVVSMPCWELFEQQSRDYRDEVLPGDVKARLAVEAGTTMGWHRWVGDAGDVVGIDRFGASGPGPVVMKEYGFDVANVVERALKLLGK